jgi:zinc transporter 5/7
VIVSTILIKWTGWSGFDPLASIFIALLIVASVVPLVIDSGRILCLDVGEHKEKEIQSALAEVSPGKGVVTKPAACLR